jgi:hypothetical protein
MPAIYDIVPTPIFGGMVCDVCGEEHSDGCFDFVLKHTFGYGSSLDGDSVEAAICDICLEKLLRNVPGAQWKEATQ